MISSGMVSGVFDNPNPDEEPQLTTKYIVVTGGTMSGLGKGTTISSLGVVLSWTGIPVTFIKIDPYLNVDAGTISPFEHGEVFVLNDGGEVDLDLGNYERFLNLSLTRDHNITSGKVFLRVISAERRGNFLGKTVQVVPHITNEIQSWIQEVSAVPVDSSQRKPEICLIEVGGTVGDIESSVYLEALQQLKRSVGPENFCSCHLSYVPTMGACSEQKTKPTQSSVKALREAGLQPDFIFCRCSDPLTMAAREKIALFAQVKADCVISVHDVSNIYRVPLVMHEQNVGGLFEKRLNLVNRYNEGFDDKQFLNTRTFAFWNDLADRFDNASQVVTIAIVGKYAGLMDSYLSVIKSLIHACLEADLKLNLSWIEASDLESQEENSKAHELLKAADGVLCPGGFGGRGINGKIAAANFCRKEKKPFLGICLGMQVAVIEFCRNELNLVGANSEEFDTNSPHKVVISMPEFNGEEKGGTMRLGLRTTILHGKFRDSLTHKLYNGRTEIFERHRHRYEINPKYIDLLHKNGFNFVGRDVTLHRMEVAELSGHPFFLCVQFHPEFKSRPRKPAPVVLGLILAASKKLDAWLQRNSGFLNCDAYLDDRDL